MASWIGNIRFFWSTDTFELFRDHTFDQVMRNKNTTKKVC